MKTYVLLDNDGVSNALGQMQYLKGKKSSETTGLDPDNWVTNVIEGYTIQSNTDVVDGLNEIIETEDTVLVVLSTWEHLSITSYLPKLGINAPEGTKVLEDKYSGAPDAGGWYTLGEWWKLRAVKEFCESLEEDSRIVWIDDDIQQFRYSVDIYTNDHPLVEFLLVSPEHTTGLTKNNLETIRNFINDKENTGIKRNV